MTTKNKAALEALAARSTHFETASGRRTEPCSHLSGTDEHWTLSDGYFGPLTLEAASEIMFEVDDDDE